jgi:hypothetical protein
VANISAHGIWVFVGGVEYFLAYDKFPWFREARVSEILEVELLHGFHLYWPKLDVDLELASLEDPDQFPLVSSQGLDRASLG